MVESLLHDVGRKRVNLTGTSGRKVKHVSARSGVGLELRCVTFRVWLGQLSVSFGLRNWQKMVIWQTKRG